MKNYVYRDILEVRMSTKKMADILYAVIMTKAEITNTLGIGIYKYTRHINSYNHVNIRIHICKNKLEDFEELSGFKLRLPPKIQLN